MVVDSEDLCTFGTGIDKSKSVSFTGLEFELGEACVGCALGG